MSTDVPAEATDPRSASLRNSDLSIPMDATHPVFDRSKFASEMRRLNEIRPWRGLGSVAFQWTIIAAFAGAAIWSESWIVYLISILVIGTRQHALAVLMHDASHFRLLRHKAANDLVSDLCLAFPLGVSTSMYRKRHLAHHRYTNGPEDPDWADMNEDADWRWPKTRYQAARLIIGDLLELNSLSTFKIISKWSPYPYILGSRNEDDPLSARERSSLCALLLVTSAILYATDSWIEFVLLWILPSLTVLAAIFRIRAVAEHLVTENAGMLTASRSVSVGLFERALIAPCNVNYHLEHHLFPSVPFYNLPELHRVLAADRAFRSRAHQTRGYFGRVHGVLAEVTRHASPASA